MKKTSKPTLSPELVAIQRHAWTHGLLEFLLDDNQLFLCRELDRARAEKATEVVWNCVRRMGKTHTLLVYALMFGLKNPCADIKYVAPAKTQVRDFLVPMMEKILSLCPSDIRARIMPKWKSSGSVFEFPNGSRILLVGTERDQIERARGQGSDLSIVDEARDMAKLKKVVKQVLGPQTNDSDGVLIIASTPPDSPGHYFKTLSDEVKATGWYYKRTIYDCPRYTPYRIARAIKAMGGEHTVEFRREYLCEFEVNMDLAVLPGFLSREDRLVRELKRPSYTDRYVSLDYGFKPDYMGVLFGYWDYAQALLVIEDEIFVQEATTDVIAAMIAEKQTQLWGTTKVYKRVMDAPALLRADMSKLHGMAFSQTRKDDREAAVNTVNIWVNDMKIAIHPRCKNLIAQASSATWKKDRSEFERVDDFGHFDLVAALIYLVRNIDRSHNPFPDTYGFNDQIQVDPGQTFGKAPQPVPVFAQGLAKIFGSRVANKS